MSKLHKEVVTGVVQVIKFIDRAKKEGKKSFGMDEVRKAGCDGKSDEAADYIFEFIKDGIRSLSPKSIERVCSGDYSDVWNTTNAYLERFGHEPTEPVPIDA